MKLSRDILKLTFQLAMPERYYALYLDLYLGENYYFGDPMRRPFVSGIFMLPIDN